MASISSLETVTAAPKRAMEPTIEDDIAGSREYSDSPVETLSPRLPSGKGKERADVEYDSLETESRAQSPRTPQHGQYRSDEDERGDQTPDNYDSDAPAGIESYPPTTEQEAETRRIEETLRRWEVAERQRRKNARVSSVPEGAGHSPTGSLVSDVGRRASQLWRKSSAKSTPYKPHHHTKLQSTDSLDVVPLEAVGSVPTSPRTPHSGESDPFNPEVTSPFSDSHQMQDAAIMQATPDPTQSTSRNGQQGPPRPLGLPEPKTPPPPIDTPPSARAPPHIDPAASSRPEEEEPKKVKWWHDWLCGCRESGGDQVCLLCTASTIFISSIL
ncbi:hypothetical protein CYLTODRAFT_405925 [Cylindrobasidium torrendii FP15055 ss-10]|uniref:Uncharacterized protein n=1 Tax=Cylindrobasidium torrendii FP15055 ss-10 TaxID=1314674 RepID=A0A0D7BX98_9AGAR|nr:hypothetical protein CYLTODRAFT_405925 [Cylindrobasidium torrendii FP15055 ss-10]